MMKNIESLLNLFAKEITKGINKEWFWKQFNENNLFDMISYIKYDFITDKN